MDIACIGGGPAGLYIAILLKQQDPSRRITVYERNPRGQTWGWGVVFSDETLSHLEQADGPSYRAITSSFAKWNDIDIFARGEHTRSTGHGFAGVSRKTLLDILTGRAEELGVDVRFEQEVDENDLPKADLVVVADGIRSKVRARFEHEFRPSLDGRKCKYIWLGTSRQFEAFTFIVRETPHGIFTVHAYRYEPGTSTFIVECPNETWAAAGLDKLSIDECLAYLEDLFKDHLQGAKLRENKSAWVNFATVKNERWCHGNMVLLGDAAHTAHFSIGSGTKLAMEDCIALAKAIGEHADVRAGLEAYEAERKPVVERTQKVAHDSLVWFENVRRHIDDGRLGFVFSLLTRSRRITYENMRVRDPKLVAEVTRDFAERAYAALGERAPEAVPPPMFTPFKLRGMRLDNRVVVSPMCMYSADDGTPNDFHLVHYGARALGGAGLIFTEMTDVSAEGRISPGCAGMYRPEHEAAWARIVEFVHGRSRARMCMQLGHAGRKGSTRLMWEGIDEPLPSGNWPVVSASPIAYGPQNQVPAELTREGMATVRRQFVDAARRAASVGFDMVEVHMAHGYLLASFLSPLTNRRADDYGGSLQNRMRFPLDVFEAVREVFPHDRPMSVRLSATDWAEGGLDGDDAVQIAAALRDRGLDVVDVSTGQTVREQRPIYGRMFQTGYSDQLRGEARMPTMAVGNITSHDQINSILTAGRADLCLLARPHLDDPHFTLHAAREQGWPVQWPAQYSPAAPIRR